MTGQGIEPDLTYYQVAASVFAVLLLTGIAGEIRDIRKLAEDAEAPLSRNLQLYLLLVAFVLVALVVGELVSLLVLLDPPAGSLEQAIVTACLAVSVPAVPALILLSVWAERLGEFKRIAVGALAAMGLLLAGVAGYLLITAIGNPPADRVHRVYGTCASGRCGLNERRHPSAKSPSVGMKQDGDELEIVCQRTGGVVAFGGDSSIVWDRLSNGNYVTDLFVDTPAVGGQIPVCAGPGGSD